MTKVIPGHAFAQIGNLILGSRWRAPRNDDS
jgi:hypothetical protein